MKWPWVSRETLDAVREARDERIEDLREQVEWLRTRERELAEQIVRLQRVRNGLPESGERPQPRMEPMPKELKNYIRKFGSRAVQKQQIDTAYARYRSGESWEDILQGLRAEDDGDQPWVKTR